MSNYSDFRKSVSQDREHALDGLRDGTKDLLAAPVKPAPEGVKKHQPRIVFIVFAILALNSAVSQLIIAFKWIGKLPGVSAIIFFKEFFGFAFTIMPAVSILMKKPDVRIFEGLIDPFAEGNILEKAGKNMKPPARNFVKAVIYTFGSLSNLRAAVSNLVAARWNVNIPHLQQEAELQKIGNLMFLVFDLVVKTNDESLAVNIWLFKDLILSVVLLVYAHIGRFVSMSQVYDWMADITDGKVGKEGIALGLESFYKFTNGEKPPASFASTILGYEVKEEDKTLDNEVIEKEKVKTD